MERLLNWNLYFKLFNHIDEDWQSKHELLGARIQTAQDYCIAQTIGGNCEV